MIESVRYRNYRALRDATLPLGRLTVLIGPNGSGKSTALEGLENLFDSTCRADRMAVGTSETDESEVSVCWGDPWPGGKSGVIRRFDGSTRDFYHRGPVDADAMRDSLHSIRVYAFEADALAANVPLSPRIELERNGMNLAGVLDRLRDGGPERFEALNETLGRWLPEFDRVLFETVSNGTRAILLRTRDGGFAIPARSLSQGTLFALAILVLAFLPEPPSLVGIEEPDRAVHPRLLPHIKDALNRLSHPESFGEQRTPVQVVATTHSPYFLDLFRDTPEDIVIASKTGHSAHFERLNDRDDIDEILSGAPLGEVWFTGVLGGVP